MRRLAPVVSVLVVAVFGAGCTERAPTSADEKPDLGQGQPDFAITGSLGPTRGEAENPFKVGDWIATGDAGQVGEILRSHLGPGSIDIVPVSATSVGNCIPFGTNTLFGFTGFIYRNVPAFTVGPGSKIAFDLGALNDVDVRRNIYLATANINPAPAPTMFNVVPQGIFAASGWTQVVSDAQTPQSPLGNTVSGDYELRYNVEAPFTFPGGGLIVGFGGSPPGAYADDGCEQVLVQTTGGDASGHFYARFFLKPDQTLGVLDVLTGGGGNGLSLGGVVILPIIVIDIDIKPGSDPNSINLGNKGVIPVAILTTATFNAADVDPTTVTLGNGDGNDTPVAARKNGSLMASLEDVDGDGDLDLILHFGTQALVANGDLDANTTELILNGETAGGQLIQGKDAVRVVPVS